MRNGKRNDRENLEPPEPDEASAKRLLKENEHRKENAKSIMRELKKPKKIPSLDRPIMARNLGRMFELASRRDGLTLKDYFQKAFGAQWESQYKKRARYVIKDGEEDRRSIKEFYVRGDRFLELARAMSSPSDARLQGLSKDFEQKAVLQLVERTSFDNRRAMSGRRSQEQEEDLTKVLDRLVNSVLNRVDLDEYRQEANSCRLGVPPSWPKNGDLSLVDSDGWGPSLDVGADVTFEGPHRLAPIATVCELGSPAAMSTFSVVRVPKERLQNMDLGAAVEYSIYEAFGLNEEKGVSEDEYLDGGDWVLFDALYQSAYWDWCDELRSANDQDADLASILSEVDFELETIIRVSVQLRYDRLFDTWKPMFTLNFPDEFDPLNELHETRIRPSKSAFGVLRGSVEMPGNMTPFADLKVGENKDSHLFVLGWPKWNGVRDDLHYAIRKGEHLTNKFGSEDFFKPINGLCNGTVAFPSQEAVDFLLEPIRDPDYSLKFLIDVPKNTFTKFPPGSLAEAIASNLLYAEDEKKLDRLLSEDAQIRKRKVQEFVEKLRSDYERRISQIS